MRTFIGLPFTCCLIGLGPIRCLFPCSDSAFRIGMHGVVASGPEESGVLF